MKIPIDTWLLTGKSGLLIYMMLFVALIAQGQINNTDDGVGRTHPGYIDQEPLPVYDIEFFSNTLQRNMHLNVVLPRNYETSNIDYPVLYLCHGFTSNYHEFVNIGVPKYLNQFDMIVVMVDVGNSFYINWSRSDDGKIHDYADYVCNDVIQHIDSNYRTIDRKAGRAINGISMGGFGALSMGLSHPELFCSIGSHSGAIGYAKGEAERIRRNEEVKPNRFFEIMTKDTLMYYLDIDIEGFSTMRDRTPQGVAFQTADEADRVDPFKLVLEVPRDELPHIYLDCGNKDGLIASAQEFMKLLLEHEIPFQYGYSLGNHEEDYWGREVSLSMATQYSVMLRNIWGYEFEVYNPYGIIFKNLQEEKND